MFLSTPSWLQYASSRYASASAREFLLSGARSCILLVLFLVSFKTVVLESFYVPSRSMAPTIESDDFIIVPKFAYGLHLPFQRRSLISWSAPRRGEVVVFNRLDDPGTVIHESARRMVKRVIGLGGDTISIQGARVFLNGIGLNEPYARWIRGGVQSQQTFVVPSGKTFLLGDNRDESFDSRFWSDPFVAVDQIVGPVAAVYWSPRLPERIGAVIR